jgi:YesN/AraC family two-component response regulator
MSELRDARSHRHAFVTSAHDFLLAALPFKYPNSTQALVQFITEVANVKVVPSEVEIILLDVLCVLSAHEPSARLLEHYVAARRHTMDPLRRFDALVGEIIRKRAIRDQNVMHAMALVRERYADGTLSQSGVAALLGLTPSYFSSRFRRQAGTQFSNYLRETRLDVAASLLVNTNRRIKDIWVSVGYNNASNFDHQFRERFGLSPSEYRFRGPASSVGATPEPAPITTTTPTASPLSVLIVDDHDNTRETVGRYLRSLGHTVAASATGREGLSAALRIRPRTIILDYQLPDMDGVDWLRALRQQEEAPRADVILFTADFDMVERCHETDALGAKYISKLCDIDELVALIRLPANGRRAGSSTAITKESN